MLFSIAFIPKISEQNLKMLVLKPQRKIQLFEWSHVGRSESSALTSTRIQWTKRIKSSLHNTKSYITAGKTGKNITQELQARPEN